MEIYLLEDKPAMDPPHYSRMDISEGRLKNFDKEEGSIGPAPKIMHLIEIEAASMKRYEAPAIVLELSGLHDHNGQGKPDQMQLIWLENLGYWVGINHFFSKDESVGGLLNECHSGPYKVEEELAEMILEFYNLTKVEMTGREISRLSPSELECMACNTRR